MHTNMLLSDGRCLKSLIVMLLSITLSFKSWISWLPQLTFVR